MGFNPLDYEPVAARLQRWLESHLVPSSDVFPRVITHMISAPGADICVMKAELWLSDVCIATGYAEEVRGAGNVNRTSHVENCETSAVGRALANAGVAGSDVNKRPSREEMSKVQRMTTRTEPVWETTTIREPAGVASEKQINYAKSLLKAQGHPVPNGLHGMSKNHVSGIIEHLRNGTYEPPNNDDTEEPF